MRSRFWLRPRWVVGHVLCLSLIVLFVNFGFWQLRRLDARQQENALIEARQEAAPTTVDEALRDGPELAVYRRVRVSGRWDIDGTVLVRSRSLDGRPGYHVVTPLVLDGDAVLVNRGFAPLGGGGEGAILDAVQPRDTSAEVAGMLRASEERGRFGPRDPAGRRLRIVNRIDIARLQRQSDHRLAPAYLQLTSSTPAPGDLPIVLPLPATDEGPHLSYAVQWFIFATVGAVGWPLLLRKTARGERDEHDDVDDGDDDIDAEYGPCSTATVSRARSARASR